VYSVFDTVVDLSRWEQVGRRLRFGSAAPAPRSGPDSIDINGMLYAALPRPRSSKPCRSCRNWSPSWSGIADSPAPSLLAHNPHTARLTAGGCWFGHRLQNRDPGCPRPNCSLALFVSKKKIHQIGIIPGSVRDTPRPRQVPASPLSLMCRTRACSWFAFAICANQPRVCRFPR